jgi:hypothetical protein
VLATSLDVRLGRLVNAGTSAGVYSWASNRYANAVAQRSASPGGDAADAQGSIVPGKVDVWAEVNITYAISQPNPRE